MKTLTLLLILFFLAVQPISAQEIKKDSIQKIDKNIAKFNLIGFSVN